VGALAPLALLTVVQRVCLIDMQLLRLLFREFEVRPRPSLFISLCCLGPAVFVRPQALISAPSAGHQVWFLLLNLSGMLLACVSMWPDPMHQTTAFIMTLMLTPAFFNDAQRLPAARLLVSLALNIGCCVTVIVAICLHLMPNVDYYATLHLLSGLPRVGYVSMVNTHCAIVGALILFPWI
jgi:hypothetical protein